MDSTDPDPAMGHSGGRYSSIDRLGIDRNDPAADTVSARGKWPFDPRDRAAHFYQFVVPKGSAGDHVCAIYLDDVHGATLESRRIGQ